MKKLLFSGILMLLISLIAHSQNDFFQKKDFIYKGDTLHYRVLFPKNYVKTKTYPLVLFLHGSGERGNDNAKQLVWGASLFTDSLNRQNYPSIVLFPQCPENETWVTIKEKVDDKFNFIVSPAPAKPLELAKKLVDFYQKTEAVNSTTSSTLLPMG